MVQTSCRSMQMKGLAGEDGHEEWHIFGTEEIGSNIPWILRQTQVTQHVGLECVP